MAGSSYAVDISKVSSGQQASLQDSVAVEEPLEIRIAYSTPDGRATRSVSITMRTPGHDAELAAGFLYTESIIHNAADIASIEPCGAPAPDSGNHNVIRVELGADVDVDLGRLQRHFYTTSSCGVCGKTSLDALHAIGANVQSDNRTSFATATLIAIPDKLRSAQATFDKTGGLHAAAAFDTDGDLVEIMEDVGRHNAVDKIIGSLLLQDRLPASELGLMVSGRASFELMQKTLMGGMPLLAAISAPSSLAVQLANEFDITLVGFLRGSDFNIYAGDQRITE
jgi:FdhD protein